MARAGDVIENPLSGERIHFERTGAESGGELFSGEIVLSPRGVGPPAHVHPVVEERFRVVSETLGSRAGRPLGEDGRGGRDFDEEAP